MILSGIKTKIAFLDFRHRLNEAVSRRREHLSGYQSGDSPGTDILGVVDESGRLIGNQPRNVCHSQGLLHETVHLILFSATGRMLIQRRGRKESSPGLLAQSVGGHVAHNQTIKATLEAESFQELGVRLGDIRDFLPISVYLYSQKSAQGHNRERVHLYRGKYAGKIYPNYSELAWAAYFDLGNVKALAEAEKQRFSPSFIRDLFYF